MRKIFGFVAALAGGYLLYGAINLVHVLLILEDKSMDGPMLGLAGVTGVVGLGLLWLGWILFSNPIARPGTPQAPPPQPPHPPTQPPGAPPQP